MRCPHRTELHHVWHHYRMHFSISRDAFLFKVCILIADFRVHEYYVANCHIFPYNDAIHFGIEERPMSMTDTSLIRR